MCLVKKISLIIVLSISFIGVSDGEINTISRKLAAYSKKTNKFKILKKKIVIPKSTETIKRIRSRVIKVAAPPLHFRKYFKAGTDEAELEIVTNKQIKQLFNILKTSKRRDLRLQLGSLYIDKAKLIEYRLYETYNKNLVLFQQKKLKKKPRIHLKPVDFYFNKAIVLFETYRLQFPKDKNMDQVLFFLGVSYFKRGKLKKGLRRYQALIKNFPKSRYIHDVNFELGKYYFYKYQWKKSLRYYKKIVRYRKLKLYDFALYKIAWCYFKLGKVDTAINHLEKIIKAGEYQKKSVNFSKESLNDLVIFYSQSKRRKATNAWFYFQKMSGNTDRALKMLSTLAYAYLDQGKLQGVRVTFRRLIAENPLSPLAYEYQYQIIRAYTHSGKLKIFLQELKKFIFNYGPSSAWATKNSHLPEVKKAITLTEKTIRNYALRMHKSYRKTKGRIVKQQALYSYKLYFNQFKTFKNADEMIFFYAELLFELKKYRESAKKYLFLVNNFPKSQYYETASIHSIVTIKKTILSSKQIERFTGKRTSPVPFTKSIREYQKIAFLYVDRFPQKNNVPKILYNIALLHYKFNHYPIALSQFWNIIKKYPTNAHAVHSANLILDIYNIQKDFVNLQKAVVRLLRNKKIAKSSSAAGMRKILSQIFLKTAKKSADNKEYLKSAELYKSFADTHPLSPLRGTSYYNAAFNFKKDGDILKAIAIYKKALRFLGHKKHRMIQKSILKELPILHQNTGQYRKAAQGFSYYASKFPKDKIGIDFIFNAGLIYEGFNLYSQAEKSYLQYFKKSKNADKTQVLYLLAELKKRRGDIHKALSYYKQFLNRGYSDKKVLTEVAFKIADIYKTRGRIKLSKKWYNTTINIYNKHKKGAYYVAQAKFNLVHNDYLQFIKIRMPKTAKQQQKVFQKKVKILLKLKKDLAQVMRFNSAYSLVSSLVLIGLSSEHLGDFIYNVPIPKGFTKEEIKKYKTGLKKEAMPFKIQAIKNYRLAISKSRILNTYNKKWLKIAVTRLSRLKQKTIFISVNPLLTKEILPVVLYNGLGDNK